MIIAILISWHIVGFLICCIRNANIDAEGWEVCNPYWAYQYHPSVNWFGAIVISLIHTVLCPLVAVLYWFYKLCTVGRKSE